MVRSDPASALHGYEVTLFSLDELTRAAHEARELGKERENA